MPDFTIIFNYRFAYTEEKQQQQQQDIIQAFKTHTFIHVNKNSDSKYSTLYQFVEMLTKRRAWKKRDRKKRKKIRETSKCY